MPEEFPLGLHLVVIPLTAAAGFVLGWFVRGVADEAARSRRVPPRTRDGGDAGPSGS